MFSVQTLYNYPACPTKNANGTLDGYNVKIKTLYCLYLYTRKLQFIFYKWMKFYVIWSNNHKDMSIFSLHVRKPLHPSFALSSMCSQVQLTRFVLYSSGANYIYSRSATDVNLQGFSFVQDLKMRVLFIHSPLMNRNSCS